MKRKENDGMEKREKRGRREIHIQEQPRTTLLFSRCYDIGGRS